MHRPDRLQQGICGRGRCCGDGRAGIREGGQPGHVLAMAVLGARLQREEAHHRCRVRILPGRWVRARHDVRHHGLQRIRQVRAARDQPGHHPRCWWHAASHACGRKIQGHAVDLGGRLLVRRRGLPKWFGRQGVPRRGSRGGIHQDRIQNCEQGTFERAILQRGGQRIARTVAGGRTPVGTASLPFVVCHRRSEGGHGCLRREARAQLQQVGMGTTHKYHATTPVNHTHTHTILIHILLCTTSIPPHSYEQNSRASRKDMSKAFSCII
mmetsp:Transcript_13687/g.37658  ORF Transcript_13687/g.37658 Transcript_13687/m.37658 type:complete len:268 (+) Transcript_13687:222-1025(+)